MVRQRRYRQALHRPHGLTLALPSPSPGLTRIELVPPARARGGERVLGAMRSGAAVCVRRSPNKASDHLQGVLTKDALSLSQRAARAAG
jgi:hypothetical protein